jgi:FkbM family methyltransferase
MGDLLRSARMTLLLRALELLGPRRRRVLGWRALAGTGVRDVTFESEGLTWTASPDDGPVGLALLVDGAFHRAELAALQSWMVQNGSLSATRDVVVDVGANIGSTCIPLVRATGCRALAIEPVAQSFRRLTTNVAQNGLAERIRLVRAAVRRESGRVRLCLVPGASGSSFVLRAGSGRRASTLEPLEEVDARPLDELLAAAGFRAEEIALVWADVQGCEAEVIASGTALWARGVPLWAEIEPCSLAEQGGVAAFVRLAGEHFDRFIEARDLVRDGAAARPSPIAALPKLIESIGSEMNRDALFLPPHRQPT